MTQLTRNEIIELSAKALFARDFFCKTEERLMEVWNSKVESTREMYRDFAKTNLEALEQAGVLMLVEEGEKPKDKDLIHHKSPFKGGGGYGWGRYVVGEKKVEIVEGDTINIIQRADTPVYQCKKED